MPGFEIIIVFQKRTLFQSEIQNNPEQQNYMQNNE